MYLLYLGVFNSYCLYQIMRYIIPKIGMGRSTWCALKVQFQRQNHSHYLLISHQKRTIGYQPEVSEVNLRTIEFWLSEWVFMGFHSFHPAISGGANTQLRHKFYKVNHCSNFNRLSNRLIIETYLLREMASGTFLFSNLLN